MTSAVQRQQVGAALIFVLALIMFASVWSNRSVADCKHPDVLQALGSGEVGIKVALLAAGSSSNDFLAATAEALRDLRSSDGGLIQSVSVEYLDEGSSVEQKFVEDRKKYDAFVVIDSEFMIGGYPKYNELLDYYRNRAIKQRTVMIVDRYLSARETSSFVQVTAQRGARNAALLVELAAAFVAHPGLARSKEFLSYSALVTSFAALSEDNPERPDANEIGKSRSEMIECMGEKTQ
jgi:hypothetical protein